MNVVECIEMLRNEKNMSWYKLAQKSGISQSTLSNLINRGNSPSIDTLGKICNGLGISLSEFFAIMEGLSISRLDECNDLIRMYMLLGIKEKEYLHQTIRLLIIHSQS
ncbi:transcriptional regulator with XRE-family HTH domain [Catenibacillus scindens]|uniref:Transcriptional regulator with XRE-family HTH domain n=1 Tax=Catenibacillus scindens TaxID=673271 RepID=A0A7W8HAK1_9FIRM|nr:helix-turn-helix transcriptional regulator [Catenibacillus scindens]MBB5264162.1 transcriptional regulator with XRE-family HTH domain [Catenibacillus scindens]